eukprot:762952-Hanusia_phi.AAC.2
MNTDISKICLGYLDTCPGVRMIDLMTICHILNKEQLFVLEDEEDDDIGAEEFIQSLEASLQTSHASITDKVQVALGSSEEHEQAPLRDEDDLGDDRVLATPIQAVELVQEVPEEVVPDGDPDHAVDVHPDQEHPRLRVRQYVCNVHDPVVVEEVPGIAGPVRDIVCRTVQGDVPEVDWFIPQ